MLDINFIRGELTIFLVFIDAVDSLVYLVVCDLRNTIKPYKLVVLGLWKIYYLVNVNISID